MDVDRLLARLPELQAALARVATARASVRLSLREKRPDPTLGIRAGKEDSDTLTGITLSVPLFVRNTYSAEVAAANAGLLRAEQQAASLRQQARAGLIAAAQVYRNARRAWTTWEAAGAPRLSQRTELLDRLWRAGELNTTDYLVQLKQALETEVSATEQHGRLWRAWADWLAASGRIAQWLKIAGDTQ
jgi:cobalt-zinc-cadmium efflux system outer membrane protein